MRCLYTQHLLYSDYGKLYFELFAIGENKKLAEMLAPALSVLGFLTFSGHHWALQIESCTNNLGFIWKIKLKKNLLSALYLTGKNKATTDKYFGKPFC